MRTAELASGATRLRDAADTLAVRWAETRERWRDAVARNVEENHLKPLGDEISAALGAIRQMDEVLMHAERDCGPW